MNRPGRATAPRRRLRSPIRSEVEMWMRRSAPLAPRRRDDPDETHCADARIGEAMRQGARKAEAVALLEHVRVAAEEKLERALDDEARLLALVAVGVRPRASARLERHLVDFDAAGSLGAQKLLNH